MKPKSNQVFFIFSLIAIAEITLLATGNHSYRFLTKPFLIPLLILLYIVSTKDKIQIPKDIIIWALLFSWAGDLFLMKDGFFIPGLISFLTAHFFYILFLSKTKSDQTSFFKLRPVMLIAVLAYLIELMYLLWPHLGGMKIPVLIYGITISVMLSAAFWQYQKLETRTALYFIVGAIFFVLSDSLLALNKFKTNFVMADISIMCTYILAQLLIVLGAIKYRNNA